MGFKNPKQDPGVQAAGCLLLCFLVTVIVLFAFGVGATVLR